MRRPGALVAMCLAAVASVLLVFALVATAGLGVRVALGPIRFSASDPARLLLEAAVILLAAALVARARAGMTWTALMLVLIAGAAGSTPARVGDGAEYIAMAVAISEARPPALTDREIAEAKRMLDALPGFAYAQVALPELRRDGRQDFYHFWLYSLAVAPIAALTRAAALPLSIAFTLANLLWLGLLAAVLLRGVGRLKPAATYGGAGPEDVPAGTLDARAGTGDVAASTEDGRAGFSRPGAPPTELAALVVVGPVLWWVDKAHADAFLVSLVGIGLVLLRDRPAWALPALGAAAAQQPVFAPLWVLAVLDLIVVQRQRGRATWLAITVSGVLLASAPMYYLWRLGETSPLQGTTIGTWPGLRAWLTPIVDPNLGLLVHAPAVLGLAAIGLWLFGRGDRDRASATEHRRAGFAAWVSFAGSLALLTAAAMTPNVNHGGTPGISRYALWLIAVLLPLAAAGAGWVARRSPAGLTTIAIASIAMSAYVFAPRWPDRSWAPAPNLPATWLWTHVPSLDNPLPEVFAERMFEHDGQAVLPIATGGCEKVLLAAEPDVVKWPVPCRPRALPPECRVGGALCYVNAPETVTRAPRQPGFTWSIVPIGTWTTATEAALDRILSPIGSNRRIVRAASDRAWVWRTPGLRRTHVVQGTEGLAAWTDPVPGWADGEPALVVRDRGPMRAFFYDPDSLVRIADPQPVPAGDAVVPVPGTRRVLVILAPR